MALLFLNWEYNSTCKLPHWKQFNNIIYVKCFEIWEKWTINKNITWLCLTFQIIQVIWNNSSLTHKFHCIASSFLLSNNFKLYFIISNKPSLIQYSFNSQGRKNELLYPHFKNEKISLREVIWFTKDNYNIISLKYLQIYLIKPWFGLVYFSYAYYSIHIKLMMLWDFTSITHWNQYCQYIL